MEAVAVDEIEDTAGTPASCITFAHRIALKGEYSDGFSTMVHPAARAGRLWPPLDSSANSTA